MVSMCTIFGESVTFVPTSSLHNLLHNQALSKRFCQIWHSSQANEASNLLSVRSHRCCSMSLHLLAPFLFLCVVESRYEYAHLADRAKVVPYGPNGTCPVAGTTTFEVRPVYFSDFIPTNTIIDPFQDGHPVTVTNAPTVLVILSYVTTIITPTILPGSLTAQPTAFSNTATASSILSQQSPSASATVSTVLPFSSSVSNIILSTLQSGAGQTSPATSRTEGEAISTSINLQTISFTRTTGAPPQTTVSSPNAEISTSQITSDISPHAELSTSITSSITLPPLTIGAGIPAGVVTSLPSSSPILLAVDDLRVDRQPRWAHLKRQNMMLDQAPAVTSASAISVVNLAIATSPGTASTSISNGEYTLPPDNCDDATPFILSDGLLLHDDAPVGKMFGTTTALLGTLDDDAPPDNVNRTFSLVDGYLQWQTDDVGPAMFYSCDGVLWAGFPSPPAIRCTEVSVGAMAAQECVSRVQETAVVNPSLVLSATSRSTRTRSRRTTSTATITSSAYLPTSESTAGSTGVDPSSQTPEQAVTPSAIATSPQTPAESASSSITTVESAASIASSVPDTTSTPKTTVPTPASSSIGDFDPSSPTFSNTVTFPSLGASADASTSLSSPSSIATNGLSPTSIGQTVITTLGPTSANSQMVTTTMTTTNMQLGTTALPTPVRLPIDPVCNEDNCLRNLGDPRYFSMATTFCPTYTQTSSLPIASWIDGCGGNPSRVSSACSCLITPTTTTRNVVSTANPIQATTGSFSFQFPRSSLGNPNTSDGLPSTTFSSLGSIIPLPGSSSLNFDATVDSITSGISSPTPTSSLTTTSASTSTQFSVTSNLPGALCSGQTRELSEGNFVIGRHNLEVVQSGFFSYEIACYASQDSATTTGIMRTNVSDFESAIALCDDANASNGIGACRGVLYDVLSKSCLIVTQFSTTAYPEFGLNARTARLIFGDYSFINDAFYLQPAPQTSDLGLCNDRAYSFDVISPAYFGAYDNLYENHCGRHVVGIPGSLVNPSTVSSWASVLLGRSPSSVEDCMRLCDYGNHQQLAQLPCVVYTYDISSSLCSLYGATDETVSNDPNINAGRLVDSVVNYPIPSDRPAVTGYVSKFQYFSMVAASSVSQSPSTAMTSWTPTVAGTSGSTATSLSSLTPNSTAAFSTLAAPSTISSASMSTMAPFTTTLGAGYGSGTSQSSLTLGSTSSSTTGISVSTAVSISTNFSCTFRNRTSHFFPELNRFVD